MTPYDALKQSVRQRGGCTTAYEVRHQLSAYLKQFKVTAKTPEGRVIDWQDIMTHEEWFARVNRSKKKSSCMTIDGKTKWELKQEAKETPRKRKTKTHVVQPALASWGEQEERSTRLDRKLGLDVDWIDEIARKQQEEADGSAYYGEW